MPVLPLSVATMGDAEEELDFDTSKEVSVTSTFDAMGLREDLLRGLYAYGGLSPFACRFLS